MRHGETVPYKKVCICLGSCSPVEGTEIVSVETERDLLLAWRNLIQDEDPDIMIGYNLFGFDCEFMFRRAMELGIEEEFLKLDAEYKKEIAAVYVLSSRLQLRQL